MRLIKNKVFLKLMRKLPLRIIMTQVIYQTTITVNQSLAYHHLLEDHTHPCIPINLGL